MAGGVSQKRGLIVGINVTPLVDITLVLLVVFIVTAKIVVAPAVPLDLPQASQGQEVQVVLSILLPLDGSLLVNGAAVADEAELQVRARAALQENPELRAVVNADGDVAHRRVITVLDSLRSAGVTRIAFGVSPGPTDEGDIP
jgi:biopolymer transport protein ExbD